MSDELIRISGLSFSHGDRLLYDDISLTIPRGKITALMGPSGIGKNTLVRLVGGDVVLVIVHDDADIVVVDKPARGELYELRKRMSMLFQSGALFTGMNVFDNVAYPLREHTKLPDELLRTLVLMKLESVGLRGAENLMPAELSGGMARRAALARAIALDPELIMYDEPFVGQDPITMAVLVKLISQLNKTLGITSVIVSHDVPEVMSIADYVYLIANRKVVAQGTPEQLRQEANPEVVQFVHGLPDGPVPFHYPANDYLQEL